MNSSRRRFLVAGLLTLVLVMSGCYIDFGGGGGASKSVTIDSVGWVYSNVNPSFWAQDVPEGTPTPEALVSFYVGLVETNLLQGDIATVSVAARNTNWVRNSGQFDYNEQSGIISLPFNYSSSSPYSLPLTGWEVTVELVNGAVASAPLNLSPPGSTTIDSNITHVFNENYGEDQTNRVEMVKKPTIEDSARGSSSVFITFSIDDPNAYNGWVIFFDSNDVEIGSSPNFVDASTGEPNQEIMSGFVTDGTSNNTATIEDTEIEYQSGKSFADVDKAAVIVTDGQQYEPEFAYNFRGISKRFNLN